MKKLILFGSGMILFLCAFAQEPRRDTVPIPKKTRQPPDTAFKNPIYKGPAEIDTLNKVDSMRGGRRVTPIDRYREDSIPKQNKKQ